MRRSLLIALTTSLLTATNARADTIVFRCGDQVCRAAPDGKLRTTLTGDGGYTWVSASTDGTRLGVVRGGAAYVLDDAGGLVAGALPRTNVVSAALISPDGAQIVTLEANTLFLMGSSGAGRMQVGPSTNAAWLGGRLISGDANALCLLATNTAANCERGVGAGNTPAVSRDGRVVATARGGIALFDAGTGALIRRLTTGAQDVAPSFSPDGSKVVFSRGQEIFVTAANGTPGTEKSIVKSGEQPVWVLGGDACKEHLEVKPKLRKKTIEATACAPSAGLLTVTLVRRDQRVARRKVRTQLGGLVTVSFKRPAGKDKLRVTARFQAD
jgi:dipeptidyl aminopeptidase/acylaminoacyl peptidase